ncbi:MAG: ABC transporter permease [Firmicutes bacterium]|nr:ABC transporter permease [Bacillota bacterium]HHY33969.1 ABC transporter permease [Bacillota bacterium]
MNIRAILAIMRKDLADAIRNQFLLAFLALPVGVALLLKLVLPSHSADLQQLTIVAYDPSHSRLVAALREVPNVRMLEVDSGSQLAESVRENGAAGGLAIPSGFDASVEARKEPELAAYINYEQDEVKRRAFQSLVQEQIMRLTPPPARIAWVDIGAPAEPQTQVRNYRDLVLIVIVLLSVVATGMLIIPLLLVEEKERRTLSFLLVSPAGPTDIVVGKALTGLICSLAITGVVLSLNNGWKGNWDITLLALFLGSLFTVPVGLLLGTFFRNVLQLNTWSTIPLVVLLLPSWLFVTRGLPPILQTLVRLIPTYYVVDTLSLSLAGEASTAKVWGNLAILLVSTAVAFIVAVWALRRRGSYSF